MKNIFINISLFFLKKTVKYYDSLRERDFRILFTVRTISSIGDRITPIALAFGILGISSSPVELGLVLSSRTIAMICFLLIGGVWADRLSRKKVLIGTDLLRFGTQTVTAFLLITHSSSIWMLVVMQVLAGAGQGFFRPASTGVVPETVSPQLLQQANSLLSISETSVTILGAAIAGVLTATVGPGWAIAIDAATFGISALLLAQMKLEYKVKPSKNTFLQDLMTGWSEFSSRGWLMYMVVLFAVFHLTVWAPMFVLGPQVTKQSLNGVLSWSMIMTAYGIGSIVGGVIGIRAITRTPLLMVNLMFIPQAFPLLCLALTKSIVLITTAALLSGVASGFSGTLWDTILQKNVPAHALSRVSSYDWFVSMASLPVGYAIVGPLADKFGVDLVLIVGSFVMIVSSLTTILSKNISLRENGVYQDKSL